MADKQPPTLLDYITEFLPSSRTMFNARMTDNEKELLKDFNEKSDPDITVHKKSIFDRASGMYSTNTTVVADRVKEFLGMAKKRKPKIFLNRNRFSDKVRRNINKDPNRNVDDIADEELFVLAHELGHEVDYQSGKAINDPHAQGKMVSEQTIKIDEILSNMGADQYDLREAQRKGDNKQVFADDVARAMISRQKGEEARTYIKGLQRFIDKTLNSNTN